MVRIQQKAAGRAEEREIIKTTAHAAALDVQAKRKRGRPRKAGGTEAFALYTESQSEQDSPLVRQRIAGIEIDEAVASFTDDIDTDNDPSVGSSFVKNRRDDDVRDHDVSEETEDEGAVDAISGQNESAIDGEGPLSAEGTEEGLSSG